MDQEKIVEQIQLTLKEAYHKAIDADKFIHEQRKQGHGKFALVFSRDSLFTTQADTFLPYIEELAKDLVLLQESEDESHFVSQLKPLVSKLDLTLQTLKQLKQEIKGNEG